MNKPLKSFFLFLIFFTATLLLYSGTIHAKFVFDFVDLVFDFKKRGWSDLGNFSHGFSPYLVAKLIFFVLLKVFYFNEYAWFIITCALHALNAFLLFLFTQKILKQFEHEYSFAAAVSTAIVFLVSPYHTETIVWGGALNYLIVSCFIFIHLNMLFDFIVSQKKSSAVIVVLTFFLAVFSHEWGLFLLPADILLICFTTDIKKIKNAKTFTLLILIFGITGCYFINQLARGELIGHYGAATHLNFKLNEIVPAFFKYLLKILFLFGFLVENLQTKTYALFQRPLILYSLTAVIVFALASSLFVVWKRKNRFAVPAFFFLLFFLFVFPVLNLYFPYYIKIHADRYCYLPVAFLFAGILSVLFLWKSYLKFILVVVFTCCSIFFLLQNNLSWNDAGELQQKLEKNFQWWNAKQVYILNLPDNIRGAYLYRNLRPSQFGGNFVKYNYFVPPNNTTEVLSYNLNSITDSVIVEKLNERQLKVTLTQPNIWWWQHTVGAADYENGKIKVDIDGFNHSYIIDFKQRAEGDIYLYQANGFWHRVKDF